MFAAMIFAVALTAPQEADRWSEATVSPRFADGQLQACALNFKSVQRDNLYFGGRAVGADGSLNVYFFGGTSVSAMLKVTVIDGQALRAPDTSYLVYGFETNAADSTANRAADDAGYTLSSFSFSNQTAEALASITDQSLITVGVQINGGKSAIPFRTDLTDAQTSDWSECMGALMDRIREGFQTEP